MTQRSHQESNADGNVSPKGNSNLGANRTLTTILTALKVLVTWKRCWAVPPVLHCLLNAVPAVRMPRGRSQHWLWTRTDDKSLNIQADPVDIYKPRVSWVASQSGEARWCFFCKSALLCELFQTILGFTAHICPIHTSFFCHLKCWRKQNKTQLTTLIQLFLLFIHFFTDIHKAQACWVLRSFPWLWLGFFFFFFFSFFFLFFFFPSSSIFVFFPCNQRRERITGVRAADPHQWHSSFRGLCCHRLAKMRNCQCYALGAAGSTTHAHRNADVANLSSERSAQQIRQSLLW